MTGHHASTPVGWRLALLAATLVLLALVPAAGVAAAGPIRPDSSCATESTYKSRDGLAQAELTVFNNSDETVKVWWLNYDGKRTFYRDVAPHKSYIQPTWLTHPWVITSVGGACYRFLVMNSVRQTVTVAPEVPDPEATTVFESATPLPAGATAVPGGASTRPPSAAPAAVSTGGSSSGSGPLVIVAVVAGAVAAVAVGLATTGRLPGIRRGGRG